MATRLVPPRDQAGRLRVMNHDEISHRSEVVEVHLRGFSIDLQHVRRDRLVAAMERIVKGLRDREERIGHP